ncbi:MAG: hypothetical protein WBP29_10040 [Candidatus Zixiibacteriota bacterium]
MHNSILILALLIIAAIPFPAQAHNRTTANTHHACAPLATSNPLGAEIAPRLTPTGAECAITRQTDNAFNSIFVPLTKVIRCAPGQFHLFVSFMNTQAPSDPLRIANPHLSPLFTPRGP